MKHIISLAIIVVVTTSTSIAQASEPDIRACTFEVKARCASGEARVTLIDGVVNKVEVSADWCGLPGHPGYTCEIDWSRNDGHSRWSEDGGSTQITNVSPINGNQPDSVKMTVGRYVSIDLAQARSNEHCGAGAELPRAIVIPAKRGPCRVWLGDP